MHGLFPVFKHPEAAGAVLHSPSNLMLRSWGFQKRAHRSSQSSGMQGDWPSSSGFTHLRVGRRQWTEGVRQRTHEGWEGMRRREACADGSSRQKRGWRGGQWEAERNNEQAAHRQPSGHV